MTRSTWVIRCVRGTARKLELRLDEQDIVSRLELDDQPIGAGIEHNLLTIPLPEPLRSGASRRLLLDTRRTFPPAAPRRFAFTGFPLTNAGEQSGAIAVILASNLWIDVKAARGLRRIDPRFLPPALRLHPATSMAFQFLDQPYSLDLRIEPSPPLYRSETRTRLSLDSDVAENQTTVDVHRVRGRLFEIDVAVPSGLQLISVGPPDLVESSTLLGKEAQAAANARAGPAGQIVRVSLTTLGRDQKVVFAQPGRAPADRAWGGGQPGPLLGPGLHLHAKRLSSLHGARRSLSRRAMMGTARAARMHRDFARNRSTGVRPRVPRKADLCLHLCSRATTARRRLAGGSGATASRSTTSPGSRHWSRDAGSTCVRKRRSRFATGRSAPWSFRSHSPRPMHGRSRRGKPSDARTWVRREGGRRGGGIDSRSIRRSRIGRHSSSSSSSPWGKWLETQPKRDRRFPGSSSRRDRRAPHRSNSGRNRGSRRR